MLSSIQKYITMQGRSSDINYDLVLIELQNFVGLGLARGMLVGKNTPLYQLWSKQWEFLVFQEQ